MRRRGLRLGVGLALFGLLGGGTLAAEKPADVAGVTACSFEIYSNDDDPNGLNVRAAPSSSAAIVATLENSREQDGEDFEVEMHVAGAKDGWLQIDRAFFRDYGEKEKAGEVFSGKGWVSGKLVGSDVMETVLRDGPSATAKVVARLYSPNASSPAGKIDRFDVSRIFGCKGEWADVEGEFRGKTFRGWATRLCSNQTTICR